MYGNDVEYIRTHINVVIAYKHTHQDFCEVIVASFLSAVILKDVSF